MLPVLKGKFFQHPKLKSLAGPSAAEKAKEEERRKKVEASKKKSEEVEPLPSEPEVSYVLDRIFPRNCDRKEKDERKEIQREMRERRTSMLEMYSFMGRRSSMSPSSSKDIRSKERRDSRKGPSSGARPTVWNDRISTSLGSFTSFGTTRNPMEEFRTKLLEKFTTIKEAFETFMKDLPERQITKLELARSLARFGFEWQSKQVRDSIFDRLDFKSIGRVTMVGFYVLVEASAPVRSVEDLRRRWLASRFTMTQAIMTMVDHSTLALTHRFTLHEFGSRLQLVNVNDPEEHLALFNAVLHEKEKDSKEREKGEKGDFERIRRDKGDEKREKGHGPSITVGDLAAALAVVSPCLLLEDLRDKLQKRYNGDFKKAFSDMDLDRSGSVNEHEFTVKIMRNLHLTEHEARKMFREIDVDASGEISRNEFVSAIGLSEPSLFLEDLRKKVRQRFRSFKAQFADAFQDSALNDCASAPRLVLKHFQELLLPLSMSEKETKVLFNLIDIDHDGRLSIREFVKGVRHFAPASVLEDLRVRCCQQHDRISDPFVTIDYNQLFNSMSFAQKMLDIGLCDISRHCPSDPRLAELQVGVPAQALFDILDVANNGEATFGRLLAALQSCGAGTAQRLSPLELDLRAKNDVKNDLAPMQKLVLDVKLQARQGMRYNEEVEENGSPDWRSNRILDSLLEHVHEAELEVPTVDETEAPKYLGPPRLKMLLSEDVLRQYVKSQEYKKSAHVKANVSRTRPIQNAAHGAPESWGRFWTCVQRSPQKKEHQKLEERLHAYFQSTAMKLSHDGPLYHGTEQRMCNDPFLSKSHLTEHSVH